MGKEAVRYLIAFTVLLLLTLSLVVACAQPDPIIPPTPPETLATQPTDASDNQTPGEPPPVSEAESENEDEDEWYTTGTFSGEGNDTIPSFHIYGTEWRITWTIDTADPEDATFKLVIYLEDAPYAIWHTVYSSSDSSGDVNYILFPGDKRDFFIKVTAQNLRQWNVIVEDNASAATSYPVRITYIRYRGTVHSSDPEECVCYERIEPDEYVVIKNISECYVDVTGWVLKNTNKLYPSFTFPSCVMIPGGIIRVYTDEVHPETGGYRFAYTPAYTFLELTGGLSFNWGPGDIWSNDKADIAVLYDALGNEVSRKSYTLPMKINEAVASE